MGERDQERKWKVEDVGDAKQERAEEWREEHDDTGGWYAGKQQEQMKRKLGGTYNVEGEREDTLEAEASATLEPLVLGSQIMNFEGGKIAVFQDAFNLYRIPMSLTLEAIGRVQDVLSAGAPALPAEMNREQKSDFKPYNTDADRGRKTEHHLWISSEKATDASLTKHMGHAQQLQAAQMQWQRVRLVLERQAKERDRDKAQGELEEINRDAEFVGVVIDLIKMVTAAGEFKMGDVEAGPITALIKALGGAPGLQQKIAKLQSTINKLNLKAEGIDIIATQTDLLGIIKEYQGGKKELSNNKDDMRRHAALTADVTGETAKGADLRMVTLVAEAYQELRMFGDAAFKEGKKLHSLLPAVNRVAMNNEGAIKNYQEAERKRDYGNRVLQQRDAKDAAKLSAAGRAVVSYDAQVERELPDWKQKEAQWKAFFNSINR